LEHNLSTLALNFTLQDIFGATLAFYLFPLVIVFPGYVCGWAFNLFDFRHHRPIVRLGIGLILSFAISPITFYLTSHVSPKLSLLTLGGFATAFVIILLKEKLLFASWKHRNFRTIFWIGIAWVIFVILSLINIQWKDQLYVSAVTDQITRASIIEAMTRTGVPPINTGYYPGHPVRLTFQYYFWYILCSLIEMIGGRSVDAHAALNASSAWSGLGLMATIALYLRLRNPNNGKTAWRSAKIGIGLLAVSGLDALLFIFFMTKLGNIVGNTIYSNTLQFATLTWRNLEFSFLTLLGQWVGSNLWIPHHIAALIAVVTSIMLAQSARGEKKSSQFTFLIIAGIGFASAFGLSVWVTFVFVVFWGIWLFVLLLQKTEHGLILSMILAGMVAMILVSPFMTEILQGRGLEVSQSPIVFELRPVSYLEPYVKDWPPISRSLIMFMALSVGYFVELGFFFIAGIYWFRIKDKETYVSNPYYLAEILLLIVVLLTSSFLRSTLGNNDLGWRGWLPGQFVLLVWGVDVTQVLLLNEMNAPALVNSSNTAKARNLLRIMISLGILTTIINAVFLRVYSPVMDSPEVGRRSYSARLAYDYMRDHIPADVIVQNNPKNFTDGPSGLYGTHQMIISDILAYGIPPDAFYKLVEEVGIVFTNQNVTNWQSIDNICQRFLIDVLIIKDTDPIWNSLVTLKTQRSALYENTYYSLVACGNYARNAP
jgi:hypothetical protein